MNGNKSQKTKKQNRTVSVQRQNNSYLKVIQVSHENYPISPKHIRKQRQPTTTDSDKFWQYINQFHSIEQITQFSNYLNQNQIQQKQFQNRQVQTKNVLYKSNIQKKNYIVSVQTVQKYNNFNKKHKQIIQQEILKDKSFKRHDQFSNKIRILSIKKSRHSQVIILQVHLLNYILKISILNKIEQSIIHSKGIIEGSGTFGDVYKVKHQKKSYAVKCLSFSSRYVQKKFSMLERIEFIKQTLKQYFILRLFGVLKIGPKIQQLCGFDLIMFPNCIEFSMELCYRINHKKDCRQVLKDKLRMMHNLNIVHRDIKPENIMYNPSFQQLIFIDFGGVQILNQSVGYKSFSSFFGTNGYFGPQMNSLLGRPNGFIDLYYNDLYGLRQSFKIMKIVAGDQILQIQHQLYDSQIPLFRLIEEAISADQVSLYVYLSQMKKYLFNKKWNQFLNLWESSFIQLLLQKKNLQQKIIDFFTELSISKELTQIVSFVLEDTEKSYFNEKQKNLIQIFSESSNSQILSLTIFQQKQIQFQSHKVLFQAIQICQKAKTEQQKFLKLILTTKQNIQQFIFENSFRSWLKQFYLFQVQPLKQNLSFYSFIVLSYCSLSSNNFNTKLTNKLKAIVLYFQNISIRNQCQKQDFQPSYICPFQNLKPLAQFFQYIVFKIWKIFPSQLKRKALKMILSSLILLGYPIENCEAKAYLQHAFLNCYQPRQERILYFWQIYLIIYTYGKMFINKKKNRFLIKISEQTIRYMVSFEQQLMGFKDQLNFTSNKQSLHENNSNEQGLNSNFYHLNKQLCIYYANREMKADDQKYIQFVNKICNLSSEGFQLQNQYLQRWKCCIYQVLNVMLYAQNISIVQKSILMTQNIDNEYLNLSWKQLKYSDFQYNYIQNTPQMSVIISKFNNKFKYIVASEQIYNRFQLNLKIINAFRTQNWIQFNKMANILLQQAQINDPMSLNFMVNLLKSVKMILVLLQDQLKVNLAYSSLDFQFCIKIVFREFFYVNDYCLNISMFFENDHLNNQNSKIQQNDEKLNLMDKSKNSQKKIKQLMLLNKIEKIQLNRIQKQKQIFMILTLLKNLQLSIQVLNSIISLSSLQSNLLKFRQCTFSDVQNKVILQNQQFLNKKYGQHSKKYFSKSSSLLQQLKYINHQAKSLSLQIKKSKIFKQLINQSNSAKIFYIQLQNYEIFEQQNVHYKIIQLFESIYGQLSAESFQIYDFNKLPGFQISYQYYVSKIQYSSHQIQDYQQILKFYKLTRNLPKLEKYWLKNRNNYYIYNALIYCQRPLIQFLEFFIFQTDFIKINPSFDNVQIFRYVFKSRFFCDCKKCLPKQINARLKFLQIIDYLAKNINFYQAKQHPYMSIVYASCLNNAEVTEYSMRRMLLFMHLTLQYLSNYARKVIRQNIYLIRLRILEFQIKRIQHQSQKKCYLIRKKSFLQGKSLRNYFKKYELTKLVQLDLQNWKMKPQQNKKYWLLKAKIQKFYQVKKNYVVSQKQMDKNDDNRFY